MEDWEGFEGRRVGLRQVKRYMHDLFPVMLYRTDDDLHSRRVCAIVQELSSSLKLHYNGAFNLERALTLALVHGDVEIETGDVMRSDKLRMTRQEKLELE